MFQNTAIFYHFDVLWFSDIFPILISTDRVHDYFFVIVDDGHVGARVGRGAGPADLGPPRVAAAAAAPRSGACSFLEPPARSNRLNRLNCLNRLNRRNLLKTFENVSVVVAASSKELTQSW